MTIITDEVTVEAMIRAARHTDAAQIAGGEYHSRQPGRRRHDWNEETGEHREGREDGTV